MDNITLEVEQIRTENAKLTNENTKLINENEQLKTEVYNLKEENKKFIELLNYVSTRLKNVQLIKINNKENK